MPPDKEIFLIPFLYKVSLCPNFANKMSILYFGETDKVNGAEFQVWNGFF